MTATSTVQRTTSSWRLSGRARKWMLFLHIASAGTWLGIDVVMAVLVFTAASTNSDRTRALAYQGLEIFAVGSLLTVGVISLITGIVLGLGSKYGLFRFWWVVTKLALNLLLTTLVLVALRPEVAEMASRGVEFMTGGTPDLSPGDLMYPPIVSTLCVLFAMWLSIFKPWGAIRRRKAQRT